MNCYRKYECRQKLTVTDNFLKWKDKSIKKVKYKEVEMTWPVHGPKWLVV